MRTLKMLFFLLITFYQTTSFSQQAIVAAGGDFANDSGKVSFTVGQPDESYYRESNGYSSWGGVQQGFRSQKVEAPIALAQTHCEGATIANLAAIGSALKWYNVETNGIVLSTSTILTNRTYYVSQTIVNIESKRRAVNVVITPKATPVFTQVSPICSGTTAKVLPTLATNGITGVWSPALNTISTTKYTYTPSTGQCAKTATMTITVIPKATSQFTNGAMTSNTVSATTTTGFVAATTKVGQYVGTETAISYRIPEFIGSGLSYLWTVPAGVTILGSSDTNVLTVHYNDVEAVVGTIGAIKVQAVNTNGCAGTAKSITVSKVLPTAPSSIKMTNAVLPLPLSGVAAAITTFAPYMGTTTELTLTANPSLTATSYVWELPTGVNVTNDSATTVEGVTSSLSNVITVNLLGVTSANTTNSSTATPPVVTNVLRIGVKSRNGVGVSTTSNSTLVDPTTTSTAKLLTLKATLPAAPASLKMYDLSVSATAAVADISKYIGKGTPLTLTAAVSKLASSYSWEIPASVTVVAGATLVDGVLKSTSNVITVNFEYVEAGTASLYLGVKAVNGIGSSETINNSTVSPTGSTARIFKVTAKAPATAGTVTGSLAICPTTASNVTYSITLAAAGANNYNVTVPSGCTINGGSGNTATIAATAGKTFTVNYPALFTANTSSSIKSISIQSENGFGVSSTSKVLKLTNTGAICTSRVGALDEFSVIAYPNPSSSEFTLDVQSSSKGKPFVVQVYDALVRLIEEQHTKEPNMKIGANYQSGTYILKVSQGENQKTLQVIKR
jgi:hypothetical protein